MSKIKASSPDSIHLDDVTALGHDGMCDHPECDRPIQRAIAEMASPECVCGRACANGEAALAFYCSDHVTWYPMAALPDVQHNAAWRPGQVWNILAARWPHPVPVTRDGYWVCQECGDTYEATCSQWALAWAGDIRLCSACGTNNPNYKSCVSCNRYIDMSTCACDGPLPSGMWLCGRCEYRYEHHMPMPAQSGGNAR